jgi:hypothetical protein
MRRTLLPRRLLDLAADAAVLACTLLVAVVCLTALVPTP